MAYEINLKDFQRKEYRPLGSNFYGEDGTGNTISFTNYYMEMNQKPFFGISGEFHFSRCNEVRWEDEINEPPRSKLRGINPSMINKEIICSVKKRRKPYVYGVFTFLTGVEPAAYCLGGNRSILLSYRNLCI